MAKVCFSFVSIHRQVLFLGHNDYFLRCFVSGDRRKPQTDSCRVSLLRQTSLKLFFSFNHSSVLTKLGQICNYMLISIYSYVSIRMSR